MGFSRRTASEPPPKSSGGGAVDEAVGDGLVEAEGGDAAAGLALAALGGGEDGLRHAGGAGERAALELGEGGDAGDLLDEVGLALDVGAPGGGRGLVAAEGEAEGGEDADLLGLGDVHADEAGDARGVEAVAAARVGDAAGDDDLGGLAAAEVEDHPGGELDAEGREGGVGAALEAVAGVGGDAEAPAGAGGADGVEVRRLDEDVGGRVGGAGAHAALDAADAVGAGGVADHRLGAVEDVVLAVEGVEGLARAGEADGDRAVELSRVEDVQRAVAVVGDEVGDVDERRDRAEADGARGGPGASRARGRSGGRG